MIGVIVLSTLLNVCEITAPPPEKPTVEARKRGKNRRDRRRGGNGLR